MKRFLALPIVMLVILLAACSRDGLRLSSAMEASIAKQYATVSDLRIQHQVPWQEGTLALVTFDAVNSRDTLLEGCYGIGYYRSIGAAYYSVFSSASSCSKLVPEEAIEGEPPALETIPYGSLYLAQQDTTVAFGRTGHSEGVQVRLDWLDGQEDKVDVVNQFYIAPREGASEVREAVLLDTDGGLLASVEP